MEIDEIRRDTGTVSPLTSHGSSQLTTPPSVGKLALGDQSSFSTSSTVSSTLVPKDARPHLSSERLSTHEAVAMHSADVSYPELKTLLERGTTVYDVDGNQYSLGSYDEYGHEWIVLPPSPNASPTRSPVPFRTPTSPLLPPPVVLATPVSKSKRAAKRTRQREKARRLAEAIQAKPMA